MTSKKGGKRKAKESDKEFNELLAELHEVTKGASSGKAPPVVTKEERRQKRVTREAAVKQQRGEELQQMLEKQQQQQRFRSLIDRLMRQPTGLLPKPKTDIESESKTSPKFASAVASMQGWREAMEDAHFLMPTFQVGGLFGVFDGHAGARCSALCRTALPAIALKHLSPRGIDFVGVFKEMDALSKAKLTDDSGSTGVVVHISDAHIACAHVGDSRAVLCRGGKAVHLTQDHKPELPVEHERIKAAGGTVSQNRVNGQLAMSRAFGDFQYKKRADLPADRQLVVAIPDVTVLDRSAEDQFVLVACDGIFDVLSNEDAVAFVSEALARAPNASLEDVCGALCQRCIAPMGDAGPTRPDGTDNMTVVIIKMI